MRLSSTLGAALAVGITSASPVLAIPVLLDSFTHNYGSGLGLVDPGGSDALASTHVTVTDQSNLPSGQRDRFYDSVDFSSLTGSTIDSIALTLTFSGAGPSGIFGLVETWRVRIQGSNSNAQTDDYFAILQSSSSPQTFTLSSATDIGAINSFATSLANGSLTFWFAEETGGLDGFTLSSARIDVYGTPAAVVPLPAGGLLLIGALGGLAALRRKRRA